MPTKLVSPGKFRKILHPFPRHGTVEISVEASAPIDIYILDEADLPAFRRGESFEGFTFRGRDHLDRKLDLSSKLSGDDGWYLILDNVSDRPVAVHYEVYY